ncbi:MAG: DUF1819 family protein [Chloroflexi bacterium]|nr:DUF1819 family protein [Chloroflexota bacterium]
MSPNISHTRWRATTTYTATNVALAGLVDETRLYLQTYDEFGDEDEVRRVMVDERLPQRSRVARAKTTRIIRRRLLNWGPPDWVLGDLVGFARQPNDLALKASLLLHVPRQDALLYDIVQKLIWPKWLTGEKQISRSDVQRILDDKTTEHPEIEGWSTSTRNKLASNMLSITHAYGLLSGKARAQSRDIVEPVVPDEVAQHLIRMLRVEGIPDAELAAHPDWRLWLWDEEHAVAAVNRALEEGINYG